MDNDDSLIAAVVEAEPLFGPRMLLLRLYECSASRGGCDGCPDVRTCWNWWCRVGCDSTTSHWRRDWLELQIMLGRITPVSPTGTPERAPTQSRPLAAAAPST